jgi:3',5'-cyclic AMP phosphodiesterase CpdA
MEPEQMTSDISRRRIIQTIGAAAAWGSGLAGTATVLAGDTRPEKPKRVLRIAHLSDIHIQPERNAAKGLTACLHHVQGHKDRPDMILTGGDLVMDSLGADEARTRAQWDLFRSVMRAECSLAVEHCLGNHDVWGLDRKASRTTGNEPLYGKKWAMEVLGLERPYRAFSRAGWRFIVLDSTFPKGSGYIGRLDETQFEWLQDELARTDAKTPVLVVSHIPILAAAAFLDGNREESGDWQVPAAWMHIDLRRIKDLFARHPNVKVCLSGHLHLVDRVDYCGVTYLCDGAVCAAWWNGPYQECEPGYALVDLYADGTFERQYVTFGWKPAKA